jgi:hypothetical protein
LEVVFYFEGAEGKEARVLLLAGGSRVQGLEIEQQQRFHSATRETVTNR